MATSSSLSPFHRAANTLMAAGAFLLWLLLYVPLLFILGFHIVAVMFERGSETAIEAGGKHQGRLMRNCQILWADAMALDEKPASGKITP